MTLTSTLAVVAGTTLGLGVGWESSQTLGASIDIGPGLIGVLTILLASAVQIAIATIAYFSAKLANKKADESRGLAVAAAKELDSVKGTVVTTEKLVNDKSTKQDAKIAELEDMVRQLKTAASDVRAQTALQNPPQATG
jgi:hypothetical protein